MRKSSLFIVACGLTAGLWTPAIAQDVNLDCSVVPDSMTYYCNHRDQFGKNAPAPAMDPYGPDRPGMTTGSVMGQAGPMQAQTNEAYCAQRYRTYDPATHTFRGNDGRRHLCQ
jgi:hypothetical protein